MSAEDYFHSYGPFQKRHEEVKERDPEWIQHLKENQCLSGEYWRLCKEVEQLEKQIENEEKDQERRKELGLQMKQKKLERDLASSKMSKITCQGLQRSFKLEREMLLEEQKTAVSDDMKSEIQRRLVVAEREIRKWKEKANERQSEANSSEKKLELLVKEGTSAKFVNS